MPHASATPLQKVTRLRQGESFSQNHPSKFHTPLQPRSCVRHGWSKTGIKFGTRRPSKGMPRADRDRFMGQRVAPISRRPSVAGAQLTATKSPTSLLAGVRQSWRDGSRVIGQEDRSSCSFGRPRGTLEMTFLGVLLMTHSVGTRWAEIVI